MPNPKLFLTLLVFILFIGCSGKQKKQELINENDTYECSTTCDTIYFAYPTLEQEGDYLPLIIEKKADGKVLASYIKNHKRGEPIQLLLDFWKCHEDVGQFAPELLDLFHRNKQLCKSSGKISRLSMERQIFYLLRR